MIRGQELLRISTSLSLQMRFKTAKFKPKIAKSRPLKTPSALALDHFDFYYGPMFGKKWPSIRLGLLSPNKYVAVVNTFSNNWEPHSEIIKDLGAFDLIKKMRGNASDEAIENKKRKVEMFNKNMENTSSSQTSDYEENLKDEDGEFMNRSAASLGEYQQSSGTLSLGSLQMGSDKKDNLDFEITGFEGEGVHLPLRKHFMYYPENLQLLTFDRGVLDDFPPPVRGKNGVPSWWLLDGGSLVPVLALGIEKGDHIFDMCAAPGGKSLLTLLSGLPDKLVCNDFKLSRLGQLKRALTTYVPFESPEASKVIIKRKDASDIMSWNEIAVYDKVIADVPCSTDRLAVNQDEGNMFSTQMTNQRLNLPQLQTKILINALRSVKMGGSVVYSTCTLSSSQNEAVVENAVAIAEQKFGIKFVEESLHQLTNHLSSTGLFKFSEQCKLGSLVLPYLPSNFGPMYVCKLTRCL